MNIKYIEEIDSTNAYLKLNYQSLKHFQVISAKHQTNGKGRLGNHWFDDGESALFSILIKENIDFSIISKIPLIASVSVHKVLCEYANKVMIKWPNDLYVNDKKIAGILSESIINDKKIDALIIGFGINVNQKHFIDELSSSATSIQLETKKVIPVEQIIERIIDSFTTELKDISNNFNIVYSYYKKNLMFLDQTVSFIKNNQMYYGKVDDVTLDGYLVIENDGQQFLLDKDDVSKITIIK